MAHLDPDGHVAEPVVRIGVVKQYYALFLRNLPVEATREYWTRDVLRVNGTQLSGSDLLEHIWAERGMVPAMWMQDRLNGMEPVFIEHGLRLHECWKTMLGALVTPTATLVLHMFQPLLAFLDRYFDHRSIGVRHVPLMHARVAPGSALRLLAQRRVQAGTTETTLAFAPDLHFRGRYVPVDAELSVALPLRFGPQAFGGRAFDDHRMLVDMPQAHTRVDPESSVEFRNGSMFIDGETAGRSMRLSQHLANLGFAKCFTGCPDPDVCVMSRSYFSPRRMRESLHEGCAYGAPLAVVSVSHRNGPRRTQGDAPLKAAVEEIAGVMLSGWQSLEAPHRAVVDACTRRTVRVRMRHSDAAVFIDDSLVTSGIQGRLLLELLRMSRERGGRPILRRELSACRHLITDPVDTGLGTRMRRLAGLLSRAHAPISIVRCNRGTYEIRTACAVEFDEIGDVAS